MSTPYVPQTWTNGPAGNTPLNDTRLDYMEAGIAAASTDATTTLAARTTVTSWRASRGSTFQGAHRGSGDIIPEYSLEAFDYAYSVGAQLMEVSVVQTADGVLLVNHDLTYDRTMNLTGTINTMPSSVLRSARITKMRQTGRTWCEVDPPRPALLADVLRRYGGKTVLCIEAKDDAAYPAMMALIEGMGLKTSVIVKAYYTSGRVAQAKAAGYPVLVYFNTADVGDTTKLAVAAALGPDYFAVPAHQSNGYQWWDSSVVAPIVAAFPEVWVSAVHRRATIAYYTPLGVKGFLSSGLGYTLTSHPLLSTDAWAGQATMPGEITQSDDPTYAAYHATPNIRVLGYQGGPSFLCLGTFCPLTHAASSYQITFDVQWQTLPTDSTAKIWLAWGRSDDRFYQTSYASGGSGNQAYVRLNGTLGLNRHDGTGTDVGTAQEAATTALTAGGWISLRLQVTSTQAILTRTDGTPVSTAAWIDSTNRGGYLHIGRTSSDGVLWVRNCVVA